MQDLEQEVNKQTRTIIKKTFAAAFSAVGLAPIPEFSVPPALEGDSEPELHYIGISQLSRLPFYRATFVLNPNKRELMHHGVEIITTLGRVKPAKAKEYEGQQLEANLLERLEVAARCLGVRRLIVKDPPTRGGFQNGEDWTSFAVGQRALWASRGYKWEPERQGDLTGSNGYLVKQL